MQKRTPFREILADTPIIAAVKDMEGLDSCLDSDIQVIFILFGDVCSLQEIVKKVKDAGKIATPLLWSHAMYLLLVKEIDTRN